jgi:hypothetical protein
MCRNGNPQITRKDGDSFSTPSRKPPAPLMLDLFLTHPGRVAGFLMKATRSCERRRINPS